MGQTTILLTPDGGAPSTLAGIPHTNRTTAWDMVQRLMSSLGGNPVNASDRDFRTAILDAHREFGSLHRWNYLYTLCRFMLQGQFQDGTVQYQVSAGAVPNLLTLSGATWPSWATFGAIRIGTLSYQVKRQLSTTTLQLDPTNSQGSDQPSGTVYSLYRDTYTLPEDFVATDRALVENNWAGMTYVRPQEWFSSVRYLETYGPPRLWTIRGDPHIPGRLALSLYPLPDVLQTLDFVYQRRMRPVTTFDQSTGTLSADLGTPTTLTLSGGRFTVANVGDVLRLSGTKDKPDGREGVNPFVLERNILEVVDAQTVTVDDAVDQAYNGAAYRVSSPVDLEDTSMLNAFVALTYLMLARARRFKPAELQSYNTSFMTALELAKDADSRDMSRRQVELHGSYKWRLRDMPRGPDIS